MFHRLGALSALAWAFLILVPDTALARTVTIRWTFQTPGQIDGFRIYKGPAAGQYGSPIYTGIPALVAGVYEHDLQLADDEVAVVAISAYSGANESGKSNSRTFVPPLTNYPDPAGNPLYTANFASGWVDTAGANSLVVNDSLFSPTVVGGSAAIMTSSGLTNIHSHYQSANTAGWNAYEFRGRMKHDDSSGGVGVTIFSQYPGQDRYYRVRRYAGQSGFHSAPHPAGVSLACTSSGSSPSQAGVWYQFRFQGVAEANRTVTRAKVWPQSGSEPSGWQVECQDTRTDRLTSGSVGLWSMGSGNKVWADLEVYPIQTGAAAPPPPPTPPPTPPPSNPPVAPVLLP